MLSLHDVGRHCLCKSSSPVLGGWGELDMCFNMLCHCAGSCIQWGGRLNQGRKEWSSPNPGDARGCLFFWKRQPLGKPRCGRSTCQRSPPHRWGFTSGCFHPLTIGWIHWQNASQQRFLQEWQFGTVIIPLNSCNHTVWLKYWLHLGVWCMCLHDNDMMSQPGFSSYFKRIWQQKRFQWSKTVDQISFNPKKVTSWILSDIVFHKSLYKGQWNTKWNSSSTSPRSQKTQRKCW